tara:strand:+ start:3309 stop:3911 length:603 start_codon:yes stop_codon:yes gene_type:complete
MLGVNVAKVSINSNKNIDNNGNEVRKIKYFSSTKSLVNTFFPVSNYHETVVIGNDIVLYKKDINQINYQESSTTFRKNDTTFYKSGDHICSNCHNIFSLLDLIQSSPYDVINQDFIIDREGKYFKANFSEISKDNNILTLKLDLYNFNNQNYNKRKHDIFLWGLFLPNCNREISIDLNTNQIVKCKFQNPLISLEANLIK